MLEEDPGYLPPPSPDDRDRLARVVIFCALVPWEGAGDAAPFLDAIRAVDSSLNERSQAGSFLKANHLIPTGHDATIVAIKHVFNGFLAPKPWPGSADLLVAALKHGQSVAAPVSLNAEGASRSTPRSVRWAPSLSPPSGAGYGGCLARDGR